MADVPIYVAVITAAGVAVGALISQVDASIRAHRAKLERRERARTRTREACLAVLSTADELRTLAQNLPVYRGGADGMRGRVEEARRLAKATRLHVADISMLVSKLIDPADQVASAASDLADDVARNVDPNTGMLTENPDVTKLVECIAVFRQEAVKQARD